MKLSPTTRRPAPRRKRIACGNFPQGLYVVSRYTVPGCDKPAIYTAPVDFGRGQKGVKVSLEKCLAILCSMPNEAAEYNLKCADLTPGQRVLLTYYYAQRKASQVARYRAIGASND